MKTLAICLIVTASVSAASTTAFAGPFDEYKKFKKDPVGTTGNGIAGGVKTIFSPIKPRPNPPSYLSNSSGSSASNGSQYVDRNGYVWTTNSRGQRFKTSRRAQFGRYSNGRAYWYFNGKRWEADSGYNRDSKPSVLGNSAAGVPVTTNSRTRYQYRIASNGAIYKYTIRGNRTISRSYVGRARLQRLSDGRKYYVANGMRPVLAR